MKSLKNLIGAAVVALSIFGCPNFTSLDKPQNTNNTNNNLPVNYSLTKPVEVPLGEGYIKPSGISKYDLNPSKSASSNNEFIFVQAPSYKQNGDSWEFAREPEIRKYSQNGSRAIDITSLIFKQFLPADITNFLIFDKQYNQTTSTPGVVIPKELDIEALTMADSSILIASNVSKKIYQVVNNAGVYSGNTFLENIELLGTTDFVIDSSLNKMYIAQTPVKGLGRSLPRIVSVDLTTKNLTKELDLDLSALDSTKTFHNSLYYKTPPDANNLNGIEMELGRKMSMVQNSAQGLAANGYKFYVSDFIEGVIYAIDGNNKVSILKDNVGHPTALSVSDNGNLFVSLSPELGFVNGVYPGIVKKSKIKLINPTTKQMQDFYEFSNDLLADILTGDSVVGASGGDYTFGVGMSMSLTETLTDLTINLTNSFSGKLDKVVSSKITP